MEQLEATTWSPSVISNGWFCVESYCVKASLVVGRVSGAIMGNSLRALGAALSNALNCEKEFSVATSAWLNGFVIYFNSSGGRLSITITLRETAGQVFVGYSVVVNFLNPKYFRY